jgi:membrane protease YdiL (CAAX protease family)
MSAPQEQHEQFPGLWGALWLVLASFLCQYAVMSVLAELVPDSDAMAQGVLAQLLGDGMLFTGLMAFKRLRYADLFHAGPGSVRATMALTLLPVLALVPGLLVLGGWMSELLEGIVPLSAWEQRAFSEMASLSAPALVGACLLAPVLEEMLFRGIILRSFLKRYPPGIAIVHSAAVFGLAHMNLYQFAIAMTLGLVLGWLYERTRSLWPCIALHASYNIGVTWLSTQGDAADGTLAATLAALLSATLALLWLRRFLGLPGTRR